MTKLSVCETDTTAPPDCHAEPRADALDHNAQDIEVGQAGLTVQVLCSPFAVDQRVVFGVFGEILSGGAAGRRYARECGPA